MNIEFLFKSVGLAAVYVAAAKLSLVFATVSGNATLLWIPGGVALAAVILGGLRYLPAVFISAYFVGFMLDDPVMVCIGAAIGNTLETYIGYVLIKRYGKIDLAISHTKDLFLIILLGGMIPSLASAVLGPLSLHAANLISTEMLPTVMERWWRSDVLGIVFFTPLILLFANNRFYLSSSSRVCELIALWLSSLVVGQIVFLGWSPYMSFSHTPDITWIFPSVVWAGLRTGRRNSALIQLMFLLQALASAYLKVGIFADDFTHFGLANFWMFAMLLGTGGMAMAILSSEKRDAMRQITLNAKAFTVSTEGGIITDASNKIVAVNPSFTHITGYLPNDVIGKTPQVLSLGQHSHEFYEDLWKTLNELGHWEGRIWDRRKDGVAYLERLSIRALLDDKGRVVNYIYTFFDITESKSAQDALAHQAQHDFLTNLPNRMLFCDRFTQQLAIAKRHDARFAVIYLDLDKFKSVNDMLGHQIGDQLLIAVANRLTSLIREIDTISRFGGDEFAILVSEVTKLHDVTSLADKILLSLSETFMINRFRINVSGSLGIALYPDHGADMETLINKADAAMYQAKRNGQNTYVISEASEPVLESQLPLKLT